MRDIASFEGVFLHRKPVDGRKQINGLSVIVEQSMGKDPFSAALFAFISKSRDTVRLLYWDRTGYALWIKRLEKEKFKWPLKMAGEVVAITPKEISWLLDGIDIMRHQTLHFSSAK